MATQQALVLHKYGDQPILQEFAKPVPAHGQLLIKVQASTVNPSDRLRLAGAYFPVTLPAVMGLEGTGQVIEANGELLQEWVGKRVSFVQDGSGSWGEWALAKPISTFPIGPEVSLSSAASGIVNPLTVVGFTEVYAHTAHAKGMVHTAAGSALGRMLSKRCKRLGIPLLNIVRMEEQALLLKSEGAEHVIVTKEGWEQQYAAAVEQFGFNVLFDALGGGPITEKLIMGLPQHSVAHIYGYLEAKPLTLNFAIGLSKGIQVTGFLVFNWFLKLQHDDQERIKKDFSDWLINDLSTPSFKTLHYADIAAALELAVTHTAQGKITLVPN